MARLEQVDVWAGLDVGKEDHFAEVLDDAGERLFGGGVACAGSRPGSLTPATQPQDGPAAGLVTENQWGQAGRATVTLVTSKPQDIVEAGYDRLAARTWPGPARSAATPGCSSCTS